MTAVPAGHPSIRMRKAGEMVRFCLATMSRRSKFRRGKRGLAGQFLQEFLFVQPVFESLSAVDKNNGDLVRELALQLVVGFDIHFTPMKAAPALQLRELLFYDFAKVASLPGVHNDFAQNRHRAESSKP